MGKSASSLKWDYHNIKQTELFDALVFRNNLLEDLISREWLYWSVFIVLTWGYYCVQWWGSPLEKIHRTQLLVCCFHRFEAVMKVLKLLYRTHPIQSMLHLLLCKSNMFATCWATCIDRFFFYKTPHSWTSSYCVWQRLTNTFIGLWRNNIVDLMST